MSVNIKNLGWWATDNEIAHNSNKVVLPTTTGTTIVIIPDSNAPEPYAQNNIYGTGADTDVVRVFSVAADGESATEVATISTGALMWAAEISADLYSDNSIGIVFQRSTGLIQFVKVTTGTWAVSAAQTVTTPTGTLKHLDISVSDGNVPAVAYMERNTVSPKSKAHFYIRGNTPGTFTLAHSQDVNTTADPNNSMMCIALQWVKGGSAAARNLMWSISSAQATGVDQGTKIYTGVADEATGGMVNETLRATYLAGNMSTTWGTFVRRAYLFATATNEITIAIMETADKKNIMVARVTFDGTTWVEVMPPQISVASMSTIGRSYRMAASYAQDTVNFYYMAEIGGFYTPINYIASIDRAINGVRFSGWFRWDNQENTTQHRFYPMAGTGRNAATTTEHSIVFFGRNDNMLWHARYEDIDAALAPTAVTPLAGASVPSGTPPVSLRARVGKRFPQSRHKAVWQIASDASFTTSVKTYEQADTAFMTIYNTELTTNYVYMADTWPTSLALTSGNWFVRAAIIDEFGNQGAWSAGQGFSLFHPPTAINLSPSAGTTILGAGVTYGWTFADPSPGDTQSAYQIVVELNSDGTVIYDSGKVTSASASHSSAVSEIYAGQLLRWSVRLWDADDTVGEYSEYETFAIASAPTVVINAPTAGATVTSGTPVVLFTPTLDGGRNVRKYQVIVTQAGTVVRDSGQVPVDVPTTTQLAWRIPEPLLDNGVTYQVKVEVADGSGMSGVSATHSFTINMTAPALATGLTIDMAPYNVDDQGYISILWNDTNRDVDFDAWIVSRKADLIDSALTVVEEGTWEEIARVVETQAIYEYKDYYAPSGYKVNYRVQQLVDRAGDRAISGAGTVTAVYPQSEGYWLIEPLTEAGTTTSFRLHNVTADDYSPEYEESEYNIINRGRHVDRGDYLGVKGTLTAQLRDGGNTTARQKRLRLDRARALDSAIYLRNPFGDVYYVSIGNLTISRLAGVGRSEFVDVTIPYSEVADD